jgi:hypothetical protein
MLFERMLVQIRVRKWLPCGVQDADCTERAVGFAWIGIAARSRGTKQFSGKVVLRVDPAIHRRLAAKALAAGESLDSYCVKTLVKA